MRAIAILFILLLISGIAGASPNTYTHTLTTTSELSNGAWYTGYTIGSDKISLSVSEGEYISPVFSANNLSYFDVTYSDYEVQSCTIDYALLKSNSLWINSTDARHIGGGHAYYSIRYPFVTDGRDAWFVDSSSSHSDLTLIGASVVSVTYHPYQNYLSLDGVNDYGRVSYTYDYDAGGNYWYMAGMINAQSKAGMLYGAYDAHSNAYIGVEYVDAASDYLKIHIQDQNGNFYTYSDSSKTITPGAWHYVALRGYNGVLYLYCDGILQTSGNLKFDVNSNFDLDYISIGAAYTGGSPSLYFGGWIDEFRFHAGALQATDFSNTGLMASYMWDCVEGDQPPKATMYKISGSGYNNLFIIMSGKGSYNVLDMYLSWLNTDPHIVAIWPTDEHTYDTGENIVLTVNASDVDVPYGNFMATYFYMDDVYLGYDGSVTNGEMSYTVGTLTGGAHTWKAETQDNWLGSVWTSTYDFYALSTLYIRDEGTGNLIDDATVKINFYTTNTSTTKFSTDGSVDLTGLPIQNILVTAYADKYTPRKTIVSSLYDTQNIYMINENESVIYNTFKLNTQSISYPVTDYWIDIQKPMNGTVDTVFSSYFGFDGSCGTYLIASDVYRLVIHAPDGSEYAYGWLYPDPDGTMEITINSVGAADMVTDWLTTSLSVDEGANSFTYSYSSDKEIDTATFIVTEDNETLQEYSVDSETGTFVYSSDNNRHHFLMNISIVAADEATYNVIMPIDLNPENINPFPSSYPDWFKQVIVSAIAIMCILAFSSYRADVGCIAAAGVFCTAYIFDWFPISQAVIYTIILIAAAAAIKFKRKQNRVIY